MTTEQCIREALANSEAAFHQGWRSGDEPGELCIPVDVAVAVVLAELGQLIEPEQGPVRPDPDDGRRWHRHGVPPGTTAWCRADLPSVVGSRGCGMDHLTWVEVLAECGRVVVMDSQPEVSR